MLIAKGGAADACTELHVHNSIQQHAVSLGLSLHADGKFIAYNSYIAKAECHCTHKMDRAIGCGHWHRCACTNCLRYLSWKRSC